MIVVDPGHGGKDSGAVHGTLRECDIALRIAEAFCRVATFETKLTRTDDRFVSLHDRAAMGAYADLFLSIHLNADPDDDADGMPEATGSEIWVYPGSKAAMRFATGLRDVLRRKYAGTPFRGIKESSGLYVLRSTPCPAALVEVGFIDSKVESQALASPAVQSRLALLLAEAVSAFLSGR